MNAEISKTYLLTDSHWGHLKMQKYCNISPSNVLYNFGKNIKLSILLRAAASRRKAHHPTVRDTPAHQGITFDIREQPFPLPCRYCY